MALSRRQILVGALAGGGVVAVWLLLPGGNNEETPIGARPDQPLYNSWLKIGRDGSVTVAVPQLEMGQGVTTLIPQVIAQELGADWRTIAVEPTPPTPAYANQLLAEKWAPMWNAQWAENAPIVGDWGQTALNPEELVITADGSTVAQYVGPAREAAATVRAMLCMAAADRWDVDWETLDARRGFVWNGDKKLRFADLLDDALNQSPPGTPPLRDREPTELPLPVADGDDDPNRRITYFPRLDLPSKVDGSLNFAGDIRLPDMVYAAIRHGPLGNTKLKDWNSKAAEKMVGLQKILTTSTWIAAVASNWWTAQQAINRMKPIFTIAGEAADSTAISTALETALNGKGYQLIEAGDIGPDFAEGAKGISTHAAFYDIAPALHASIETSTATARFADGRLELWMASQSPQIARQAAASALGISVSDVVLYPMMAGGSFDRRLDNEVARDVAVIAKKVGKPVQLVWSRAEEAVRDLPRAPARARAVAAMVAEGRISSLSLKLAAPATNREFGRRLGEGQQPHDAMLNARGEYDRLMLSGAEPFYAIPNYTVDHHPADIPLPTGRWRTNGDGINCFVTESFLDECAHLHEREPLSYRIEMLGQQPRLAECLSQVAVLAEWDAGLDQSGQGLACHTMNGGYAAVIATARRGEKGVEVEKLTAVLDIGRIINRDIALQQAEGAMIWGMAMAMGSSTTYSRGLADVRTLRELNLPTLADCPEVRVHFIDSVEEPVDPGELAGVPVAPAIANALFSATGLRFRSLPLVGGGL